MRPQTANISFARPERQLRIHAILGISQRSSEAQELPVENFGALFR